MTAATVARSLDPRELVTAVSLVTLFDAYCGDHPPFGLIERDDGSFVGICPRCGRHDHNGGTAELIDTWRWRCGPCRHTGTRVAIERIILEDADVMDRFFRLIAEGAK